MFTDTHCHLLKDEYENFENILNVIKNAKKFKVNRFINSGINNNSNIEILDYVKKIPEMYGVIGIHPSELKNLNKDDLLFLEKNINENKIIGIGEIGLDYHYEDIDKIKQKEIFEYQLKLAEKFQIPVVIHSRDATEDTIKILKKYNVKGIIHSFSGSIETAKIYIKMGYLLGVNGIVTFKNCKLKEVLTKISLENIVLETDSPYLTPEPFRGQKNEPKNIYNIALFLCDLYNITPQKLAKITNDNISRIFDI